MLKAKNMFGHGRVSVLGNVCIRKKEIEESCVFMCHVCV